MDSFKRSKTGKHETEEIVQFVSKLVDELKEGTKASEEKVRDLILEYAEGRE